MTRSDESLATTTPERDTRPQLKKRPGWLALSVLLLLVWLGFLVAMALR